MTNPAETPATGAAPGTAAAPAGSAWGMERVLRRAPERREITLILSLVLLLNFLPGGLLQLRHLRWGLLVTQIAFIAAPVFLAIRWFYLDPRAILPFVRTRAATVAGAMLGALGLNHVLNYLMVWQDRYFPLPEMWRGLFEALGSFDGPLDFVMLLILLGVIPGLCEEVLFRGYVHAGLKQTFRSGRLAVLVGGLIFAAFHLNPWRFDALLAIGFYLGFLRERTGSLVPPVVAHALINIQSVALAGLGPQGQDAVLNSPWSHVVALACLASAALLLRGRPAGDDTIRML